MCAREIWLVVIMAVIGLLALALLLPVHRDKNSRQEQLVRLQEEQETQNNELKALVKENDALRRNDPQTLMKVARDTYRYCYPGEKIYHFPQHTEPSNSAKEGVAP